MSLFIDVMVSPKNEPKVYHREKVKLSHSIVIPVMLSSPPAMMVRARGTITRDARMEIQVIRS